MGLRLLFASRALACLADDVLGAGEPCRLSLVKLLQRDLVLLLLVGTLARATRAAATHASHTGHAAHTTAHVHAEHLRQQIIKIHVAAHAAGTAGPAAVEGRHAMHVVYLALLVIKQDFVGLRNSLEFDFGFLTLGFGDFVGVRG